LHLHLQMQEIVSKMEGMSNGKSAMEILPNIKVYPRSGSG
jgi:hypothetical protein